MKKTAILIDGGFFFAKVGFFIERMGALFLAVVIAIGGIVGSMYAAMNGYEKLSWIIASTCIGSLAIAFLKRNR